MNCTFFFIIPFHMRSCYFFFFHLHPRHMEVPRSGIKSDIGHSCGNARFLAHWAQQYCTSLLQRQHWILKWLFHSGNSGVIILVPVCRDPSCSLCTNLFYTKYTCFLLISHICTLWYLLSYRFSLICYSGDLLKSRNTEGVPSWLSG